MTELAATDHHGRALVGVVAAEDDRFRATITADGATVYDKVFPTEATARVALKASLGMRATVLRRRKPKVRVATRRDRPGWWLFYRLPNGRRVVARAGADLRRAKALAQAVEARVLQAANGVTPAASLDAPTFTAFATEVIEKRWAQRVKPQTIEVYRGILTVHLLPRLGARRLDAITRADLKQLAYDLLRANKAPATVRRIFAVLSIVLNEAEDDELLARHPGRHLQLGKLLKGAVAARSAAAGAPEETDAESVRCLTPEQVRALLDGAATWPFDFQVLLLVLARTGVRIGEAVGLQWGDLDLDARVAHVRRTCKGERVSTPKSGKGRRVHLTPQLCEALRELHRQRRVVALDDERRAREWVFPDKRSGSKPMQYRRFYERFVPLAKRLGLRGVTPHTLRHTYASLLFAQGKRMHFVQEQLGHHDPRFTASVYGHLIPGDRRGEVDFLDYLAGEGVAVDVLIS